MTAPTVPALADAGALEAALRAGGLSDGLAAKGALFAGATQTLRAAGADAGCAWFVPGRIEVLGKHTDYGGGRSLVAAVERGFCLVAAPRGDDEVRVHALDRGQVARFRLDPELSVPHGVWANYPMTVARRLARNFPECRTGADIAFGSDLPPAAGMSSSSALIVATWLALAQVNGVQATARFRQNVPGDLACAEYLGTHENGQSYGALAGDRGVGTFGGSEDHTAILCSRAGHLGQFRYCPTRCERTVPLPPGYALAVGVSGVVAEKTGAAQTLYNRASLRARALVEVWRAATGRQEVYLADALRSTSDAAARLRAALARGHGPFTAEELRVRLDHFEQEDGLIDPAGDALAAGDVAGFGAWVDRSQQATETLLGNQVPETIALARAARAHGAAAASAFGAGFGGSVWALVRSAGAEAFLDAWSRAYAAAFPGRAAAGASFFTTPAGPAAFRLAFP